MHKFLRFSLACPLYLILNTNMQAGEPEKKQAILLKTEEISQFRVYCISRQLEAIPGVHLMGYLVKAQTLMISYDPVMVTDPSIIITAVEHLNKGTCVSMMECDNVYAFIDRTYNEPDCMVSQ